jgi:ERCC4-related helicase
VPQRVRLRDEVWYVESQVEATNCTLYQLRSVETGSSITALCPPDIAEPVSGAPHQLDRRALTPFGLWQLDHELIRLTTTWQELAALHSGRVQLEPYQLAPVIKLLSGPRRRLLIADDVGLGKTVEAGLCLMELMARGAGKRVLLIVPPGLIDQWLDEMQGKFGLAFTAIENSAALDQAQTALADGISPWIFHDRVITSTEYIKRPDVRTSALRRTWDVVVVDEAHYLAESGSPAYPYATRRTQLGVHLHKATRALILLTATPHNGYRHSFRSLLELIEPTDATLLGNETVVRQRVARTMIRRLKQQITRAGPDGSRVPAFVPREPVERLDVHCPSAEEREIFKLVTRYCSRTVDAFAGSDQRDLVSFAMQIVKKRMLSSRLALRRTIDHRLDALKQAPDDDGPTRAELRELQSDLPMLEQHAERLASRVIRSAVASGARARSAEKRLLHEIRKTLERIAERPDPKIERLLADLRQSVLAVPGEKAIIFTEYRDTMEAIRTGFEADPAFRNRFVELTGGLTPRQRRDRIATFASPGCLILLATDAASEGLNLQEFCRRLYHVELPWNPNRMEQRNGRIDRYGQHRSPQIAYLYYADSPEDRVLDRIITRILQMQADRVSTPDIVGILESTRIPDRLLAIRNDEEAAQTFDTLERVFNDERTVFERDIAPLLTAGEPDEVVRSDATSADPMLEDDVAFESAMLRRLGANARPSGREHEYRVTIPIALQGAGVAAEYRALTFRRSVALASGMEATEFVHRLHPLARVAAADARARLTGASGGIAPPPYLAVRQLPALDGHPSAIFTFTDRSPHAGQALVSVGLSIDGAVLPDALVERALEGDERPGEVSWGECAGVFEPCFADLLERAGRAIAAQLEQRVAAERLHRQRYGDQLRTEVEAYCTDRIEELHREEAAERAGGGAQGELFGDAHINWSARRAAVATYAQERLRVIREWESVQDAEPEPLGILLAFPGERA